MSTVQARQKRLHLTRPCVATSRAGSWSCQPTAMSSAVLPYDLDQLLDPSAAARAVPDDERHAVLAGLVKGLHRFRRDLDDAVPEIPQPIDERPYGRP